MNNETGLKLIVECERLNIFLGRNQLVQANAIAQKLENMLLEIAMTESKPETLESHPLWAARRAAYFTMSEILNGRTKEAVDEANKLFDLMRTPAEVPK